MECDKYDIFLMDFNKAGSNESLQQIQMVTNSLLIIGMLFLVVQLYWGIKNQLNSNKFLDDFNSNDYNSENYEMFNYENFKVRFETDVLTKDNTSFNTYVGLNSWIMNDEINNIIEEKDSNISYFQKNYANSSPIARK